MAHSHLSRRVAQRACALVAATCVLLAIATAAHARPTDTWPERVLEDGPAPTDVTKTVLRPARSGPDTLTFLLIATGAAAALLAAGYVGARVAIRTQRARA